MLTPAEILTCIERAKRYQRFSGVAGHSRADSTPVNLSDLVASSAKDMQNQLEKIRIAATHAGLKGTAAEEILAEFLRERLPASLGVTAGQVVDRDGNLSKQVDVVIFDATRTPKLFTSPGQSWDVVPAEGVLAVIEVKMHLTAADIPSVLANAAAVLDLRRDAYIGPPIPRFHAHGNTYSELPICYCLFAFESDSMYAQKLNELQADLDLARRMTSACYLDRGVSLHFKLDGARTVYAELPVPPGFMVDVQTDGALLVWFTSLSTVIFQAELRPISLIDYAGEALKNLPGTLNHGSPEERAKLLAATTDHVLGQLGIPPGIGAKMYVNKSPLDQADIAAIKAAGGTVSIDESGLPHISLPQPGT
jgi:Domain of unknown function (DUF6602)